MDVEAQEFGCSYWNRSFAKNGIQTCELRKGMLLLNFNRTASEARHSQFGFVAEKKMLGGNH